MHTVRIIPCLDVKDGQVVKGVRFVNLRHAGDPVELAKRYSDAGADEIIFLDITATVEKRATILDVVTRTAEQVFVPLAVGGGVRSVEDIRALLNAGADKVGINSAAVRDPDLVRESARRFGSQCIVVAIDAKRVVPGDRNYERLARRGRPVWEVYVDAGRTPTGLDAVAWAREVVRRGAGEILLTSIDADGTTRGFDIPLTRAVVEAVPVPVIASGGAGAPEHFVDVVRATGVSAVLAASVFHYRRCSIARVKHTMQHAGIGVRL